MTVTGAFFTFSLLESIKKGSTLSGRTENMRTAHFLGSDDLIGEIVSVKINDGFGNSLKAELI